MTKTSSRRPSRVPGPLARSGAAGLVPRRPPLAASSARMKPDIQAGPRAPPNVRGPFSCQFWDSSGERASEVVRDCLPISNGIYSICSRLLVGELRPYSRRVGHRPPPGPARAATTRGGAHAQHSDCQACCAGNRTICVPAAHRSELPIDLAIAWRRLPSASPHPWLPAANRRAARRAGRKTTSRRTPKSSAPAGVREPARSWIGQKRQPVAVVRRRWQAGMPSPAVRERSEAPVDQRSPVP